MNNNDPFFKLGTALGFVVNERDTADVQASVSQAAIMQSVEAAPFNRELCKIAAAAFDASGTGNSPEALLFKNLATTPEWSTGYNAFTDCVKRALAKQAGAVPLMALAHDKVGGRMMKNVMTAGVLGGGTLGALAFLLARNAKQSSASNEQMLEKIRAYKELSRDIREDMGNEKIMEQGGEVYDV